MKKSVFIIVFLVFLIGKISGQTIKGVIVDAKTNEGLPSANIYISNTTKGTQTDLGGRFQLSNVPLGNIQVVVSYVGYEVFQQNIDVQQGKNFELNVKLVPNNKVLDEIAVKSGRDKTWERQLKQFKRAFFGDSPLTSHCKILNEWVIDFEKYPSSGAFVATAQRPIEIENRALGYKLFYDLIEFKQTNQLVTFVGSTRFEELQPNTEKEAKLWEENKKNAYLGSTRHFFRCLINGTLEKEGFYIYRMNAPTEYSQWDKTEFRKITNLISDANSTEILKGVTTNEYIFSTKNPLEITYTHKSLNSSLNRGNTTNSRLKQIRPSVIMSDGWANDPLAFEVIGFWSNERIANLLPREYGDNIVSNPSVVATQTFSYPKVYLQTNKSDYVTGERIWLSAFIAEGKNHALVQEIKPLYVQLYNLSGDWITEETIYTDRGRGTGYLAIGDSLFSGIYRLKAFTREMLNAPMTIFEKQITIQNPQEKYLVVRKPQNITNSIEPPSLKINISSDKNIYQPREKITLKIEVKNGEEFPTSGTFSMAVTDLNKIPNQNEDIDINAVLTSEIPDIQPITNLYVKESNLSMKGKVKNQRTGKTMSNVRILAILLDSTSNQTKVIETDKNGKFYVEKIDFEGDKVFTYDIMNKKNQIEAEAVILFEQFPPHLKLPILTADQIPLSEEKRKEMVYLSQNPDGQPPKPIFETIILEEKLASKDETFKPSPGVQKIYDKADYSVTFDENSPRFANVFEMIEGRLPGVRVLGNFTSGYRVYIRGIGTWNNNDPLVIVDGMEVEINALRGFVNPNDVERIDVLSSGGTAGVYGVRGANGVIVIYTRRTSKPDERLASAKRYLVKGYQREVAYLHPDYQSLTAANKSDFRTTIYWNPEIITNEKGEASISFYAADTPSTYRIIIEGINAFGQIGRKETRVEVK